MATKSKITKPKTTQNEPTLHVVKEHYEDYPYPYRNPDDELKQLIMIQGEYLGQLNHWLFKGKQNFDSGFRCLIAGGGTGDSAIYLGEQLKNKNAEVVYLDFSQTSMDIAKKRAEIRGLKNITWIQDSIMNIPKLNLGKFDYINCVGVLHHLASPPDGLKILKDRLADNGGMGFMIYGKYGRTGVYQVQEIMRIVNEGVKSRVEEVMNGKIIVNNLPATNWYIRGQELLADHKIYGDVGLYDMFLHKQDRAYSIPDMYELIHSAGLNFVEFTDIKERLSLKLDNYINDFSLLQKLKKKSIEQQQAIAELLLGNIIKHSFMVSNKKDTEASIEDLDNVPYFYGINDVAKQICDYIQNNKIAPGNSINFSITTNYGMNVSVNLPISIYTEAVFKQMIDTPNTKSFIEIFDNIRQDMQKDIENEMLIQEIKRVFTPFISLDLMLLRNKLVTF